MANDTILRIPEFILINGLRAGLAYVIQDYRDNITAGTEVNSWLYQVCKDIVIERYNFYEQAKTILLKEEDDPRLLTIDLMFNMKTNGAPHIYITLPSEQHNQRGNALGVGEGYAGYQWIDTDDGTGNITTDYRAVLTRRKAATYHIVITSDNTNEVIFLYHLVTAILISLSGHFTQQGLENFTFSGRDIEPYSELIPSNIFMRAIGLGLEYNTHTLSIPTARVIENMEFTGKPVNDL